jgi:hypothetical protein
VSSAYLPSTRRRGLGGYVASIDDFMNWLLYGEETWLVAVLKGVPLFFFMYFLLFYIPNYVYYAITLYIPFLQLSEDVGFLVANLVGGGNFTAIIVMVIWAQAARGRRGFFWSLIRYLVFLQYAATLLVLLPFMVFNLGGGSLVPPVFTLQAISLGVVTAGLGAATLVYMWLEYVRVSQRQAEAAAAASSALQARA